MWLHTLNPVQSFKYLVNERCTQEEEIKNRIAKYSQSVGCMYRLLKDRNVPKKAKEIIHQTILRPILIQLRPSTTRLVIRRIGCNAVDRASRIFGRQGEIYVEIT